MHKINLACYSWLHLVETNRNKRVGRFLVGITFIYRATSSLVQIHTCPYGTGTGSFIAWIGMCATLVVVAGLSPW